MQLIDELMGRLIVFSMTLENTLEELKSRKREAGQTMVEYGLIVALISIAAISVIVLIGPKLKTVFQTVVNNLHS